MTKNLTRRIALSVVLLFAPVIWASAQTTLAVQAKKNENFETDQYKILFPGPVVKTSQILPTKVGDLTMSIVSYEPSAFMADSNHLYMVAETMYPSTAIHSDSTDKHEIFFRGSIEGMLKNVSGKLISETSSNIGKYPSRRIEVDYQNGLAIIRMTMVLRESRMIIIQTITGPEKYPNGALAAFFESFMLK